MTQLENVLYLYRDNVQTASLEVPGGEPRRCCPCPEHWASNYVAKVAYTDRVAVGDAAGNDFEIAYEPCTVSMSGVSPSRGFADSTILFVTNGAPYMQRDFTVLGLKIARPEWAVPLERYNQLSPSFGYPVEICTNLEDACSLILRTDVLLDGGVIRLALENADGGFQLWLPGWTDNHGSNHAPELLLDSVSMPERYIPVEKWRNVMRRYFDTKNLEVKVLSSATGGCNLKFEYAANRGTQYVHDFASQKISSVNPVLLADYDRDGAIGAIDIARKIDGRTAYFWVNDDKWKGDDAFASHFMNSVNSSDSVINGRNDLINFLPIAVDIAPLASHWSSSAVYYRIEAYSSALRNANLAFADVAWSQIGDTPFGNDMDINSNSIHEAPVFALGGGTNLPPAFVSLSQSGSSTLLMEFPDFARNHNLHLKVYSIPDDALLFSTSIGLHIGDISGMIGWENLRSAAGGSDGVPSRLATDDWPTSEHEPGNVVFVHGYNMEEDTETPLWAKNVFKKLWWAGLDRGFIAVQWRGNEGQTLLELPLVGYVTPNYYGNVQNAFATAPAFKTAMDDIAGPKWFLAHSLGNMLVSAAIQDYQMPHEKYFMLNAAVAMEAYDSSNGITGQSHDDMTPVAWTNYADAVRSTHWFERFPEGDGRRLLTWKNRFSSVTNVVNFYSSQEDVVCNGDGTLKPYGRNYSWYNQEYRKGTWAMMLHEYEGGWEFNPFYDTVTGSYVGNEYIEHRQRMSPQAAADLTDEQLRQHSFFLDFCNPEMHTSTNGMIVASNYLYRAEMLAYAIPSESYALGANPLTGLNAYTNSLGILVRSRNYNMATFTEGQNDLPPNGDDMEDKHRDWRHSTFVQRSYKRTHQLFREIIKIVKEGSEE